MCKLILALLVGALVYFGLISQDPSENNVNRFDNLLATHKTLEDQMRSFNLLSTWLNSHPSSTSKPPSTKEDSSTPLPPEQLLQKLIARFWPVLKKETATGQQEQITDQEAAAEQQEQARENLKDDNVAIVSPARLTLLDLNPDRFVERAVARLNNQEQKTINSIESHPENIQAKSQSKFDSQIQQVQKQLVELTKEGNELQKHIEQLEVQINANHTKGADVKLQQRHLHPADEKSKDEKSKRYWENYDDIHLKYDFNLNY